MAHAAKNETEAFGLLEHSMKRLTAPGRGSYDERQARFDAATPACTPRDVMCPIENWKDASRSSYPRPPVYREEAREFPSIRRAAPSLYFETKLLGSNRRNLNVGLKAAVDRSATENCASYNGSPPASRQATAKTIDTEPPAQAPRSTPSSTSDRESAAPPRACAGRRRNSIRSLFAPPSARRRRSR